MENILRAAGDHAIGLYKGFVVDNRDPWGLGRVRIWSYALHGDFSKIPIEALPWAESANPQPGAFSAPPMWSRVWFGFDTGHKYHPVYIGFWNAIPNGTGQLPFDSVTGTEVRPEAWDNHDLTPESLMVASTPEGNSLWMSQKFVGKDNLHSSINLLDTAGKTIGISSYHQGVVDYKDTNISIDPDKSLSDLAGNKVPDRTRTGTDIPKTSTGMIDLFNQNLRHTLQCDDKTFSQDVMTQLNDKGDLKLEKQAVQAEILMERCDGAIMAMTGNTVFMNGGSGMFMSGVTSPPRRYITT